MALFNYSFFFDFHTLTTIPDVGRDFNAEKFVEQLKNCGIDFLTFHARCNQGNAYYDTKIGTRHPSLTFDMFGQLAKACHARGIRISAYFNVHLSDEELIRHPEWEERHMNPRSAGISNGPHYREACYNSKGYREHLLAMTKEVLENYDVDGFFFDCLSGSDCICPECVEEMKARGLDPREPATVKDFSEESCYRISRFLHDELVKIKPGLFFFYNGQSYEIVRPYETHLECECLPTGGWGYDFLPLLSHYLRTICHKDSCVLNMTGRFNNWGHFGSLRTIEGVEYDLLYGLANGMRPDLSDHLHPRGDWPEPVYEMTKKIYRFLQQYDRWTLDAENRPEIALVYPRRKKYDYFPWSNGLTAAVRMLTELKVQFDVVSDAVPWEKYKLLIFVDDVVFTPEIAGRVKAHIDRGGAVLASAESGLTPDRSGFALKDDWPVEYVGPSPWNPLFYQPEGPLGNGLPELPLVFYSTGTQVKAARDAEVNLYCVKPYVNSGWDGLRTNYYIPPEDKTDVPFVARKRNVVYIAGKLFEGYFNQAMKDDRVLLKNILELLDTTPQMKTANLPSFSRAFLQFKGDWKMVHLLTYCPERRMNATALEDRPTVRNAVVSVRTDGKAVGKVYLAPTGQDVPFVNENGYCTATIPQVDGYALVIFE